MAVKVIQMESNNGRAIPNQFIIYTNDGKYFQSYDSIIAFVPNEYGKPIQLGNDWNYSRTTGKYRNQFLGTDKKGLLEMIDDGRAVFKDLDEFGIPDKSKFYKDVKKLCDVRENVANLGEMYDELEKLLYGDDNE